MSFRFSIIGLLVSFLMISCQNSTGNYVCPPCNMKCDQLSFAAAGTCPNCKMELLLKSELEAETNLELNKINLQDGAGVFLIEGIREKEKSIKIYYHKPANFTKNSKVVMVLPGAGRGGNAYRNAWKAASEKYNVLVITPEYSEKHYPEFWNYNLGGMIYDVNVKDETYKVNQNPDDWIFGDFDAIFELVKSELNFTTDTYDLFGHSAGGQILHRLAIFYPHSKANRILAANSGWYTIPTSASVFPYGLRNIRESVDRLDFSTNFTVFLGENDNASETRGELRRSPEVDVQGLHRLDRGTYFYEECQKIASEADKTFNWKLEIVPNVGHDFVKMSQAAAEYLYGF